MSSATKNLVTRTLDETYDEAQTEDSLQEYLVLASVFVTCEFNNVSVLRFLLSGENTLGGLLGLARRRAPVAQQENVASVQTGPTA